ncbi:MAG: N-acylglucosamine 2-epimerase [Bacteroides sp. SM23_62_1]|nr:MAG: N-acylglucosamine 2-epimerase [Bacteroides sp. SM23_62_1]
MKQFIIIYVLFLVIIGCTSSFESENQEIAEEMEESLKSELLDAWYPLTIDTVNGGFWSDFTWDWKQEGPQNKMIVTQTRHVWTSSNAALFINDDIYWEIAEHGYHFLRDKMWDTVYGGFYMIRNTEGGPLEGSFNESKSAYGNAFGIYSLTAYYVMSGDTSALDLAKKTFYWLEKHSHDPAHKGYFDRLMREGSPLLDGDTDLSDDIIDQLGWKDQNSSIHLLEAFTELYASWPDSLLEQRLREMLYLVRDVITTDKGYLTLFFKRDWTPISYRDSSQAIREANYGLDHVSFGHDIETAYLMLEASHALGLHSDHKTLEIAKKMVDHSLAKGWDRENGGLYYEGYYHNDSDSITIINESKSWWVQAETLNALLLMAKLFPEEEKYYETFKKQWEYIKTFQIDHEHGGWYRNGLDKNPEEIKTAKASNWKVNYHNMRALMNCIKMLRGDHELTESL